MTEESKKTIRALTITVKVEPVEIDNPRQYFQNSPIYYRQVIDTYPLELANADKESIIDIFLKDSMEKLKKAILNEVENWKK